MSGARRSRATTRAGASPRGGLRGSPRGGQSGSPRGAQGGSPRASRGVSPRGPRGITPRVYRGGPGRGRGFRRPGPKSPDRKFREHFHYQVVAEMTTYKPEFPPEIYVPQILELGNFTRFGTSDYHNDLIRKKWLIEPQAIDVLQWNLNRGMDMRRPKDPACIEKIDNLLKWITVNFHVFQEQCESEELGSLHTTFVCYRSLLATIMSTPHELSKGWVMGATRYRDSIYMTQYKPGRRSLYNDDKRRSVAWRHKFEQYMVASHPDSKPKPKYPVDETEVTYSVTRNHISKHHSILFAARVVAVDSLADEENTDPLTRTRRYVDLRVQRRVDTRNQQTILLRKMLKWWCKAIVLDVPRVICGYRDDVGVVENIRSYTVHTMEELCRPIWKGSEIMAFLQTFLDFVLQNNGENDRRRVTLYEYNPETRRIKVMVLPNNDPFFRKYQVLPEWYIDDMEDLFVEPE